MHTNFQTNYQQTRATTNDLCAPLLTEDYIIQSMDDVSPPKWHLAHTTWFFETFLLQAYLPNYKIFDTSFQYLYNSYYQAIGAPFPRAQRGLLSRPTVDVIYQYRNYVDEHMLQWLQSDTTQAAPLITLGLQHEQQHQELLLTDIKYNFSMHPTAPIYQAMSGATNHSQALASMVFVHNPGGQVEIGYADRHFCFDNELPRHAVLLKPYLLANRLVTNAEYLAFIEADGYKRPAWWLADGWDTVQKHQWQAPLYWQQIDGEWHYFTLQGLRKINLAEPVSHVSYYEADAYARWAGKRLPTEFEWEHFSATHTQQNVKPNLLDNKHYHPIALQADSSAPAHQLLGDVWEWTASPYCPYPGYQAMQGALGEYNGKFMSNQMVLRGGSCVTPATHIRTSYRNFFQPDKRWQFTGIRLAQNSD